MLKTTISCARRMFANSHNKRNVQLVPDFTQNNYKVTRGNFNVLLDHHVAFFQSLLGKEGVFNEENDLERYNVDWHRQLRGKSKVVLRPKTTDQVSKILAFCNDNRLAVCPQGGNTCVSGASVPVFDEIILSTDLLNKIIKVDENSGVLVCQAGCVVETLNNQLAESNLILPLDLGSKASCQIGGNVSTNAGGLRFFRYGSLHANVLGLEVVKANGEVLDCLSTLKKDNTGYHLHHLFIGSEGTLGVVTKVAIQCPTQSKAISLAFLGFDSYENVIKTFKKAKTELGEIISAVEVVDTPSMDRIKERLNLSSPIGEYSFYLFLETKGSNEEHDQEKLHKFLESTIAQKLIVNGTVTTEPTKYKAIWSIRERLPEAFLSDGYAYTYDFTLPLEHYYKLVSEVREHVGSKAHCVAGFGHLGDGNLHLQVSTKAFNESVREYIESFIYKRVKEMNGSISAEHGIGFLKAPYLKLVKNKSALALMKDLKTLMDPNGILNPYKVLAY